LKSWSSPAGTYRDAGEWARAQKEYGQAHTVEAMEAGMDLALELSYRQFVQRESAVALIRLTDLLAEQERFAEARFKVEPLPDQTIVAEAPPAQMS
jgi:hypothetical protein